jgi:hypothetical protein
MSKYWFLRIGDDAVEEAQRFTSKRDAVSAFRMVAAELAFYGQAIEATIHIAPSRAKVVEYPDFVLSLNENGRVVTEQA